LLFFSGGIEIATSALPRESCGKPLRSAFDGVLELQARQAGDSLR
jgi:hypothetical protein